ncbi:MAG: amino acid aminotransferase [Planctomycetota bacterium]|jgi:aspartate/tyrosine/aromatic aminotransferase
MFESIETAPADPILGLTDAFNKDTNPDKINLSVGVYKDPSGVTPVLETVKAAQQKFIETETTKAYKPITGDAAYGKAVVEMLFGADHPYVTGGRAAALHSPGGTGALRVAGDYIHKLHPGATLWMSDPTWANHNAVFAAAALPTKSYPYFDAANNSLDFDAMIGALKEIPAGDVVLLHGCCHNPTGVDPTPEQWAQIGQVLAANGVLPLVDFAYQGFAIGIEEDAAGLRALAGEVDELMVCSSFSKNFGLYNERVGALTFVAKTPEHLASVMSQVKICVRTNYSNPPAHGAAIVTTILGDADLRAQWEVEVKEMRDRINGMRELMVKTLAAKGVDRDMGFITAQKGMFSFSGLNKEQVQKLRDDYAIYIVGSGRINVAGLTEGNMERFCDAFASVL